MVVDLRFGCLADWSLPTEVGLNVTFDDLVQMEGACTLITFIYKTKKLWKGCDTYSRYETCNLVIEIVERVVMMLASWAWSVLGQL
jgi:hypothetical protein